jgi:serine/threonine protein kinase/formylglycine-generating enzyme required for sulfatase activity
MPVKTWGDFEVNLDKVLGRGGMGAVFMGRQISLDRPAAIKLLKKELVVSPEFVKRFHREAALLARLVDQNVVQVFGAGEAEGEHFYAMEFVEGEDFASKVRGGYRFTVDEVLQVALGVGKALMAAWRHRIIHRDIKPSNIILTKDHQIKVMDFGLAKSSDMDLTQSEAIMGTAKYMSPEQATGSPCDIRSDLYSLGVVLYELSTGRPPFAGESATTIMYQHVHQAPRPPRELNPSIPPGLEQLILRLMSKAPGDRFATPEALVSAIQCIVDGVTPDEKSTLYNETVKVGRPDSETENMPPSLPPPRKPSSLPLYVSLGAAVAILGVLGVLLVNAVKDAPLPADPPHLVGKPPPQKPPGETPPGGKPSLPAAAPWEEEKRRGMEAFSQQQWTAAYTLLEEARAKGASDVDDKIARAHANDLLAKGDEEKDEEKAVELFLAARKFVGDQDDQVRGRIAGASFRRWKKSAERNEGNDWSQAAADWGRALGFAENELKGEIEARKKFCENFADVTSAHTKGDWRKALAILEELAKNPRNFSIPIDAEMKRARSEIELLDQAAGRERRREFEALVEQGRGAVRRAAWREAKTFFDRALETQVEGPGREEVARAQREVRLALSPPAGMVYVPAGKFRMGGGREVEGPEGEAETAAYYMDDHEVTAAEYTPFVQALEGKGHLPTCPKDEPPGKSHLPGDWGAQPPADPVVNADWYDAVAYAAWRKKRLPTEREWERAAAFDPAGRRVYPWGREYQKDGGKSYLGIDGLGSGVIEWTADWFQRYPWSTASHLDFGEKKKVLRGGVLLAEDAEEDAKVTHRYWYYPTHRSRKVGFRCVQDAGIENREGR